MPGTYRHDRNLFPAAYPPSWRGARCALFVCEVAKDNCLCTIDKLDSHDGVTG
jgi:hypothetical protein